MHRLDSGHFAVEDCLEHIATNIERFYEEKVKPDAHKAGLKKGRVMSERCSFKAPLSHARPDT